MSKHASLAYALDAEEHWRPTAQQRHLLDAVNQMLAARTPQRRAIAKLEIEQALAEGFSISGENRLLADLTRPLREPIPRHEPVNRGRRSSDRVPA